MAKKITITIKKDKTRIPVPQKPPKVQEPKDRYDRKKARKELREILQEKDRNEHK